MNSSQTRQIGAGNEPRESREARTTKKRCAYLEAKVEARDDSVGDREGCELAVAEVAREGLADHVHAVEHQAHEHGRADDLPQLLGLLPYLLGESSPPLLRQLRDERDVALVTLHALAQKSPRDQEQETGWVATVIYRREGCTVKHG